MTLASIIEQLDRELLPEGFARESFTWNRDVNSLVQVIDLQISKSNETVTLNAGVLSRANYFVCWGRDIDAFAQEPFCTARARVGQLLDQRDLWWAIAEASTGHQIVDCIKTSILPFLDRFSFLEPMRDWLASTGAPSPKMPLPSICFAVLQSQLGDVDGACGTLAMLEKKALARGGPGREKSRYA